MRWHASLAAIHRRDRVASSLRMGELMNVDTHGFNYYPNTWHALGAVLITGHRHQSVEQGTTPIHRRSGRHGAVRGGRPGLLVCPVSAGPDAVGEVAGIAAAVCRRCSRRCRTWRSPRRRCRMRWGVDGADRRGPDLIGATHDCRRIAVAALAISVSPRPIRQA